MLKEVLIGFDARELWLSVSHMWPLDRQNQFLLQHQIKKPLSVDRVVWPSVFDLDIPDRTAELPAYTVSIQEMYRETPRTQQYDARIWETHTRQHSLLRTPASVGYHLGCWDNLRRLKHHLRMGWGSNSKPCWLIAITQVVQPKDSEAVDSLLSYDSDPPHLDPTWQLMGYDVADESGTGFISNAGYSEDEVDSLKSHWAGRFNEWHLFDDRDRAQQYVDVAYSRDPHHGPFYAYGLYGIQRVELGEELKD